MDANLRLFIEGLKREQRTIKRLSPYVRDPYHTKRRKWERGHSPRHSNRRKMLTAYVLPRMQALQNMEVALRNVGVSWREFMKAVYANDAARMANFEAMVRGGADATA
jgi:hypothetical protein